MIELCYQLKTLGAIYLLKKLDIDYNPGGTLLQVTLLNKNHYRQILTFFVYIKIISINKLQQ